ncbi:MAG: TMEM43 family protein, partial [Luteimonas sp.]
MRWWSGLLALLFAGVCVAQSGPEGLPQAAKTVADAEFGVSTLQLGLERRVEMYQWRTVGSEYDKVWSHQRIDSKTFAAGHGNPAEFPLSGRQWIAPEILLDHKPLDGGVLNALGQWRDYRPDFSGLPGNLSATFQPEGDGLGSAINPLDPQVGDLRITWRELVLPPLKGAVAMDNGVWTIARVQSADPTTVAAPEATETTYSKREMAGFVGAG